MFKQPTNTL